MEVLKLFESLIGKKVTVIVSSRGEHLLSYVGNLVSESDDAIELSKVDVSFFGGFYGGHMVVKGMFKPKCVENNIDKVFLNKKYIISCNA